MADITALMRAIDANDLPALRGMLEREPALIRQNFSWEGGSGFALNYAAAKDMPEVVELLVKEGHADPNNNSGVAGNWTPLHHAHHSRAYKAGARLLELGANPKTRNSSGSDTVDFANSEGIRNERDPEFRAKERAKKVAGTWSLVSKREVAHEYELPEQRQRLTDTFNFETRIWRATVRDMDSKAIAQNIIFFDDMPDTAIVQAALKKLQELGGEADNDAVSSRTLDKKRLGAALKPAGAG